MTAFAYMFSAALFGFGLLPWTLRGLVGRIEACKRREMVFALLLACGYFLAQESRAG
ncbi:MAG: hypothetical protein JXA78_04555 [Anaerolineales bacterium]|nr:hypothetical protein [Anaerolineales bacterium]